MKTKNKRNESTGARGVDNSALLDAIRCLHEQWKLETNANRNIEWWDEDGEWRRIEEAYQKAVFLASNSDVEYE